MDFKVAIIIFLIITAVLTQPDNPTCTYKWYREDFYYSCLFEINNPTGRNNYTSIDGTHVSGKGNADVQQIEFYSSRTKNIPSIICDQFNNLRISLMFRSEIEIIDETSFRSCTELKDLWLVKNNITEISEKVFENNIKLDHLLIEESNLSDLPNDVFKPLKNLSGLSLNKNNLSNLKVEWFQHLKKLKVLDLAENGIENLPTNIFNGLTSLSRIILSYNKLKIIHSSSFLVPLPIIKDVVLYYNKIEAIDELFIDYTGVETLHMTGNICANSFYQDSSQNRTSLRKFLKKCFENYNILVPETTTIMTTSTATEATSTPTASTQTETPAILTTTSSGTTLNPLPPGCSAGFLNERICLLEDGNQHLSSVVGDLEARINDLERVNEVLRNENYQLRQDINERSKEFADAIQNLEDKVLSLLTRPCACV